MIKQLKFKSVEELLTNFVHTLKSTLAYLIEAIGKLHLQIEERSNRTF
jgi:S-adenosylmethionine:tRNA-ribosyltransferase-isomerase (queuine synthetase)